MASLISCSSSGCNSVPSLYCLPFPRIWFLLFCFPFDGFSSVPCMVNGVAESQIDWATFTFTFFNAIGTKLFVALTPMIKASPLPTRNTRLSLCGLGIRRNIVSSIFWKILHRISKISSFNVWKNSPMKTSHLFIYLFILRNLVNHFVPSLQIFVLTWQKPRSIHSHDGTVFHTLYLTWSLFMLFNILLFFQFPVIQSGSLNFGKKHLWVIVIFL